MSIAVHEHKNSGKPIYGRKLNAGETLEPTDVYDSTDGEWEKCPNPGGKVPKGNHVVWVRPQRIPN